MDCVNGVAKLYRSVIEDVIEGVRDLFAEEGVEEQVLKDLKQLWETKVLQSKATEDFFRNSVHSPLFTLQFPHSLHQTLQSSAEKRWSSNSQVQVDKMNLEMLLPYSKRRQWQPTPVLLPGKSHGRRSLVGCSPWGRKESDTTERLHFHFSLSCTGEGNGNPIQYSCLENPRDGGAWWAVIYGVAQSRTGLKRLRSTTFSHPSNSSLVIPAGRTRPSFTAAELGTSNSSASFTFPGYPIHVPVGVTQQPASAHLYKVSVPFMVTQTSERASILQPPVQQVFQLLGQPSIIQTSIPQLNPCFLQATTEKSLRMETMLQQPIVLPSETVDRKHLENTGNEHKIISEALLNQLVSSQYISFPGVVFTPQASQAGSNVEPVLPVSARMTQNLHGPLSTSPQGAQQQHVPEAQPRVLKNKMCGCDSVKQPRNTEEPSSLPVSEKDSSSQMDLSIQVTDGDINEIIQIGGTGDASSNDETGNTRDVDENGLLGIIGAGDLKVPEEETGSVSNEDSSVNSSDNEDPEIDLVEEDPLNSGDDVSEQDVPDLFDMDNVIVCQYDKIHRSKDKWKFYLKDGVMCFGGRDYVFAKAIGDAEW